MAERNEGLGSDASPASPQPAGRDAGADQRSREVARSDDGEKTEGDTADTEIAAGDLGDELADFA